MFVSIWFLAGVAFGWWAEILFGPAQNAEPRVAAPGPDLRRAPWIIFLALVLIVALGQYFDWFAPWFYAAQSFFISPRILALASGGIVGFWMRRHRQGIAIRLNDLFQALLGSEKRSSWALQSLVAILLLFGIVLAFKPDLLDHLESFKAGEVEAKFANVSETTREAVQVNFASSITTRVTINQWMGFVEQYLKKGTPRATALDFDKSVIQKQRMAIRDILFTNYVEPLATLMTCLEVDRRIDRLRHSEDFIGAVIDLRNGILRNQQNDGRLTKDDWKALLATLDGLTIKASKIVQHEVPNDTVKTECLQGKAILVDENKLESRREDDATRLFEKGGEAAAGLRADPSENRYKLSFIDPYFIGAVGDLIALALGHGEKANFLMQVKNSYPDRFKFIQPGLINLYFQLTDAKLKSEGPWPLDEKIAELDWAMEGAEYLVRRSRQEKEHSKYDSVVHQYLTNKIIFAYRYLELYNQRLLGGGSLPQAHKVRWQRAYRQLEQYLALDGPGANVPLDDIGPTPMAETDVAEWRHVELPLPYRFDLTVAITLSTILLTERNRQAPVQACTIARAYLQRAVGMVPRLTVQLQLYDAEASRLSAYLRQIGARVRVSCPAES
jgi:hypothetical protein